MKTPNDSSSWGQADKAAPGNGNVNQSLNGLAGLFGMQSMVADNRSLREIPEIKKELEEIYKALKTSTTNELQRAIIPEADILTASISPQLPGYALHATLNGVMYVGVVLLSNRNLTISSERLNVNTGGFGGYGAATQQISVPLTPAQYINEELIKDVIKHYTAVAEGKNVKDVEIVVTKVVDFEMLAHPESGDVKDWPRRIAVSLANEWEEALLVKIPQALTAAGQKCPSPFIDSEKPYGKDNAAEARVVAVEKRTDRDGTLTEANMEVTVSTVNKNSNNFTNSREVCRTLATVSLSAVPFEDHQKFMMLQQASGQGAAFQQFLAMAGMGQQGYLNGYRPLRPNITINSAQAGEMMGSNGGLYTFLYGLFSLMVTNTNYVFMEALRRKSVGSRGNLAALEIRIEQMLRSVPGAAGQQRITLDEKKVQDTDFVNNWIRQNVSPNATFQVNLVPNGSHAAQTNFLGRLAGAVRDKEVKTIVAVIDAMTKGKFSELVAENVVGNKGWTPTKPVLIPTGVLVANGIAEYEGQKLNTLELDEMAICHYKGAKAPNAIESLLSIQYGTSQQGEHPKHRSQRLRMEMGHSIYEHGVHINSFAQTHVWAPDFMAVFADAMNSIGEMSAANNMGSFRTNTSAFQPGLGLATLATAGIAPGMGNMGFFMG